MPHPVPIATVSFTGWPLWFERSIRVSSHSLTRTFHRLFPVSHATLGPDPSAAPTPHLPLIRHAVEMLLFCSDTRIYIPRRFRVTSIHPYSLHAQPSLPYILALNLQQCLW